MLVLRIKPDPMEEQLGLFTAEASLQPQFILLFKFYVFGSEVCICTGACRCHWSPEEGIIRSTVT